MLYRALRPLLFALDAERAHRCALDALRVRGNLPAAPIECGSTERMGLRFPNRIGLAAGFDKNAEAIDGLWSLGFGFVEVGTVTPLAQPGRERPRLFRLPAQHALINRLGFPNEGLGPICARLVGRRPGAGIVGVNIGKNAATRIEDAADDYVACLRGVQAVADYVAVNISSPNTESLRELHAADKLGPLLDALLAARHAGAAEAGRSPPLLLKVSPDLDDATLDAVARSVCGAGFDGVIATNTTVQRFGTSTVEKEMGGLSGRPVHALALAKVSRLREQLGTGPTLIGVGGIDSPAAARAMRAAGADLVQLYTGLIYGGPGLVRDCIAALHR